MGTEWLNLAAALPYDPQAGYRRTEARGYVSCRNCGERVYVDFVSADGLCGDCHADLIEPTEYPGCRLRNPTRFA